MVTPPPGMSSDSGSDGVGDSTGGATTGSGDPTSESSGGDAPIPLDAAHFLRALHEVDALPGLGTSVAEMVSTWDQTGWLWDGTDFSGFEFDGDVATLVSVEGPGCIHRFSTGEENEYVVGTRIQIDLDGEPLIDVPVAEFFNPTQSPFGGLVHDGAYPTVRMPMPFRESAEVRLVAPEGNWGFFWQIAYSRLPDETLETLTLPLSDTDQEALDVANAAWTDALDGVSPPDRGELVSLGDTLAPGESLIWEDSGCGTIRGLEVALAPNDPEAWHDTQVRIRWDGGDASVAMPLATLMAGSDYGDDPLAAFDSLIAGAADGAAYLRLPMPYRRAAEIEIHNAGREPVTVAVDVWREVCERQPANFGYLHAERRIAPAAAVDSPVSGPYSIPTHRLLDRAGRGKIVGTTLRVEWPHADLWWGEGDWQIWIDQDRAEWPPQYHGTGTEEFYDGGWTVFDRKALSGAVKQRPGPVTVYGFLLSDAFEYQQAIRMEVETLGLGEGHTVIAERHPDWDTTVYWYDALPGD